MINPSSIQEVMNRADIVEVVGQFVKLRKRGVNYVANCPFHNEKSPSFSVSSTKGIFKCFGCGKGGNAVTFVQEHEKISYPEAIRWLATYYKIPLEETKASEEQIQFQQVEESLRIFNEFACQFFQQQLTESSEGIAIGMSYFKERGFRAEAIEQFRLGYCPEDGQSFYQAAVARGFGIDIMEKAGLVKQSNGRAYDVYRGRVIFPIQSMTGRVLGFGARILKTSDKAPKYINTPENELYNKSRILYGMFQARTAIGKLDECFLVEGYTDVISLHQSGLTHVVSSSGTALTEDQLRIIGRVTKNLTILYDGDGAGIKAAMRGMDMALNQSFNVKLALLPDGADPDSYIQSVGASGFNDYVKTHKRDIIGFRMELGMKEAEGDPVKKSKLVNEIAQSISHINKTEDFSLHEHYLKEASSLLQVDEGGLIQLVNKYVRERIEQDRKTNSKEEAFTPDASAEIAQDLSESMVDVMHQSSTADELQEWQLIRVLLLHGKKESEGFSDVAQMVHQRIDPDMIEKAEIRNFYDMYYNFFTQHNSLPDINFFVNHPEAQVRATTANLLYVKDEVSENWLEHYGIGMLHGDDPYISDVESSLTYFELKKVKWMQLDLQNALRNIKESQQVLTVMQQLLALKKTEKEILERTGTVIIRSGNR